MVERKVLDDEPRNVQGMTRAEFEHYLRIGYQHDNVRAHVNAPTFGITEQQERRIKERVELNYPTQNVCPGCHAFDSGASEVEFVQGCEGCMNRMLKINGNPHGRIAPVADEQARATQQATKGDAAIRPAKSHCQNGGDVCLAGNRDGVCCPEDSCDIDDGTRKNPIDAAREEQPSWTNPMTPYGMIVRALRIVAGTTLMDMATFLGRRPAELSALEFGRNPVTNADIVGAAHYFASLGIQSTTHALTLAAARKAEIERSGGES